MATGDDDKLNENLLIWVIILSVGSIFAGIRDYIYGVSSEKIGVSVRHRFFESIVKKDTSFFDDRKVGDICKYLQMLVLTLSNTSVIVMFSITPDIRHSNRAEWPDHELCDVPQVNGHNYRRLRHPIHLLLEDHAHFHGFAPSTLPGYANMGASDLVHSEAVPGSEG